MPDPQSPLITELKAASTDVDPMERFRTVHFWMLVAGAALGFIGQAVLLPGTRISVILTGLGGSLGTIGGIMASVWKPKRDRALIAAAAAAGTAPATPPPAVPPTALLALLFLVPLLSACTTTQLTTASYKGLSLAEKTVGVASDRFPALERNHRLELVAKSTSEADANAKVATWDVTASRLTTAIQGTDATVKMCRDAIAEIRKGLRDKSQLAGWIATGIKLGIDLKDLLAASGVPLGDF